MFGNMTGVDLDSESLDSDTDLNLDGVGDSDLDTAELELGGAQEAGALEAARGGMGVAVANGGTKLKGSRIRAAAAPPDDDDDF